MQEKQIGDLQKALNAAIRFIFELPYDAHVTPYYKQLGWLKIKNVFELNAATLMFKILNNGEPAYLSERFQKHVNISTFRGVTRYDADKLEIPKHRTEGMSKSFTLTCVRLYNEHLQMYKNAKTITNFKKMYKDNIVI